MIDPYVILSISDLHVGGKADVRGIISNLTAFIKDSYPEYGVKGSKVDFIVLAGDVIFAKSDKSREELYDKAALILKTMCDELGVKTENLIIVPGNHDKSLNTSYKRTINKKYTLFADLSAKSVLNKSDILKFKRNFRHSFQEFGDFYKRLCPRSDKIPVHDLFNGLSSYRGDCIRVFEEYKMVFLCINTEWIYFPTKLQKKSDNTVPYLISSVIKSSVEIIKTSYSEYTVVTVMHRNPYDLTWNDQYQMIRPDEPSPVKSLYDVSDIILTGHQHTQLFYPPHRMMNSAQLLNLGTVSEKRTGKKNELPICRAALIKLDPFYDSFEMVGLVYPLDDNEKGSKKWRQSNGSYRRLDINRKSTSYFRGNSSFFKNGFHSEDFIRCISKSDNETDVSNAILNYYGTCSKSAKIVTVECKNVTAGLLPDHESDDVAGKVLILVVYGVVNPQNPDKGREALPENTSGVDSESNIKEKVCSAVSEIRAQLADDILIGRVVIQKALVEISSGCTTMLPYKFVR